VTVSVRVAASPGEAKVAVVDDGQLIDFALWRPGAPDGVGDIHRGRVLAVVPGMAGAFVALADAEGFLPDSEGAKGLTGGTILTVRIVRAAQGNKGPRLSARDTPPAEGPVGLVRRGPTPVERFAALHPGVPILADDIAMATAIRGRVETPVFSDDVAEAIDALMEPVVALQGGASLSVWPTPALVAIDVDGGGASARGKPEALNRGVIPALAGQIRLRNLSGAIVVDLAGMPIRKRAALGPDFQAALERDALRPRFLGFTALGLAEIVRSRVHPPLHELLSGPLAAGCSALRAVLAEFAGNPRAIPAVRAAPPVVAALQADPAALPDFLRRTGRGVTLRADPALPRDTWLLEKDHG
jgi:Ribonuclease G/E